MSLTTSLNKDLRILSKVSSNYYVIIGPVSIIGSTNTVPSISVFGVSSVPEENLILSDSRIWSCLVGLDVVLSHLLPSSMIVSIDPLIASSRHSTSNSSQVMWLTKVIPGNYFNEFRLVLDHLFPSSGKQCLRFIDPVFVGEMGEEPRGNSSHISFTKTFSPIHIGMIFLSGLFRVNLRPSSPTESTIEYWVVLKHSIGTKSSPWWNEEDIDTLIVKGVLKSFLPTVVDISLTKSLTFTSQSAHKIFSIVVEGVGMWVILLYVTN